MAHQSGQNLEEDSAIKQIFEGVYFAVIPTEDLDDTAIAEITSALEEHGAVHVPLSSSSNLPRITHLIASSSDFPAYHDAVDALINVVKPSWVEQSILRKRAAHPRQFSPDASLFLSDVVVLCADDVPDGDKDAIVAGVLAMGGQYSAVMTKLVTHVVALNMENPQCRLIEERRLHCKPVLPHWFDDCLKLGKKISHVPYQLPDPPLLQADNSALNYTNPTELEGAFHYHPQGKVALTPPVSPRKPSSQRLALNVFTKRAVMLHNDLELSERLRKTLNELINKAGGEVTSDFDRANMLICQYRENDEFQQAIRKGTEVGNLNWLYYLINNNVWTDPIRRLLHFPYPTAGTPGLKNAKISVSNYTGEARIYLESLIKAAGAQFTKSMVPENTHLITAHLFSEKCNAAREWNINIVNHLWLEESYAQGEEQSLTNTRYTTFPAKTNLGEVVGTTHICRDSLFPKKKASSKGGESKTKKLEALEANHAQHRTPASKKRKLDGSHSDIGTGKENETPESGTRGAKDRALSKLQNMAPDIALFEKETKRRGGVVYGGRKVGDSDRITLQQISKESRENDDSDTQGEAAEYAQEPTRKKPAKVKKSAANERRPKPPVKRVVITGYKPWNNDEPRERKDRTRLQALNIDVVPAHSGGKLVEIIAMPRLMRTANFLVGLASAPTVVHESWFEDMIRLGGRLDERDYTLRDNEGETKYKVNLKDALERAKKNKALGGLLRDYAFMITENTKSGFGALSEIIRANGGESLLYKGKDVRIAEAVDRRKAVNAAKAGVDAVGDSTMTDATSIDHETSKDVYLISEPKDDGYWPKFREMVIKQGYVPRIIKSDWLLRVALTHDLSEDINEWECKDV